MDSVDNYQRTPSQVNLRDTDDQATPVNTDIFKTGLGKWQKVTVGDKNDTLGHVLFHWFHPKSSQFERH